MATPTGLSATAFEALKAKLWGFMQAEIYPNEQLFAAQSKAIGEASHDWHWPPVLLELKRKAKAQGLWNLFLPVDSAAAAGIDQRVLSGGGLTNRQYAEICEIMGTSCHAEFAAMACNCASPDTGNMEVLGRPVACEHLHVPRAEAALAGAAAGRPHPLVLRHDRAGRRLE